MLHYSLPGALPRGPRTLRQAGNLESAMKRTGLRDIRWPNTVAARIDNQTLDAIEAAARDRGELPSTVLRRLIEVGLDRIDAVQPTRRRITPLRDAAELAAVLSLLRSVAGNLHRLYIAHAASGISDAEILGLKHEVQGIAQELRVILRVGGEEP